MSDAHAARHQKVKDLLARAQEAEPGARAALLAEVGAADPELRRDVEELLQEYTSAERFFAGFSGQVAAALNQGDWPRTFQVDDLVAHRYRIVGFLGAGGMGEVYEAEDLELRHEHVALKTLPTVSANDERAVDRLKREIALARHVTHPNVCRVFDVNRHETAAGAPITFFTMELLEGDTLARRLRQRGRLETSEALPIVKQMAAALDAAHAADVVHGDFKPGNVMFAPTRDGSERVVVTDFGLARQASAAQSTPSTISGPQAWGTPAYMAPELFEGHRRTKAADLYAFGAVIHEMVTGKRSIDVDSDAATGHTPAKRAAAARRALEGSDARWGRAISRCLEREPDARYTTAGELVADLEGSTRRKWAFGLGTAAAVAAIVIGLAVAGLIPSPATLSATQRTVALLPFTEAAPTSDRIAFSQGLVSVMTEQLQRASATDRRLWFVPAAEVIEAGLNTPASAHRTLGIDLIVAGDFDRNDRRTAVTMNLLDAASAATKTIKTERLDVGAGGQIVLAPMLTKLTQLIGIKLTPPMREALTAGSTTQPEAEELYVRGRGHLALRPAGLDTAIDALQRAVQIDRNFALAHAALSETYLRKYAASPDPALIPRAQASGDEAIALNPSLPYAHFIKGLFYKTTGQQERAIRELQTALEGDADAVDALKALAEAYEADGRLDAAEAVYQRQIARHGQYWNAHIQLAAFRYRHGRYREAETSYLNGLKYAPDNVIAISSLAGIYVSTERFAAAEAELQKGLRLPPDVRLYNNLAWVYILEGRFQEAVPRMEQAVRLPGADSFTWGNLARMYRWADRRELATATYEKALRMARQEVEVDPTDARIRANLAYLLAETGQRVESLAEMRSTLERAPTDTTVLFRSVLVHELTGDRSAALRALETAARRGYSMVEIRRHPDLARLREDPGFARVLGLASDAQTK